MDTMPPKRIPASFLILMPLAFGAWFSYLFIQRTLGLSFFVYIASWLAVFFAACRYFRLSVYRPTYWFVPAVLVFAGFVAVRSSQLLTFLNVVAVLILLLVMSLQLTGLRMRSLYVVDYIRNLFGLPFKFFESCLSGLAEIARSGGRLQDGSSRSQTVRGIVITIPIIVLFVALFASADLVFQQYVKDLVDIHLPDLLVARCIVSLIIALVVLGVTYYLFRTMTSEERRLTQPSVPVSSNFGHIESYILFGSLGVLFLLFILVQIKYLFAGSAAISHFGFTYAQYAHKGFFELNVAAVFTYVILWAAERYFPSVGQAPQRVFRMLALLLVLETLVIMLSGFLRLDLYERSYGFTALRLYSQAFIIWLAVVFLILSYKIITRSTSPAMTFYGVVSVFALLLVMNLMNPDAFIARKNLERYAATGKIDSSYLDHLSKDAAGPVGELLSSNDPGSREIAVSYFAAHLQQDQLPSGRLGGWPSYRWADWDFNRAARAR